MWVHLPSPLKVHLREISVVSSQIAHARTAKRKTKKRGHLLVEGALDAVAHHFAADAQVGAHVRTVRVQHLGFAALRAEQDQVLPQNLQTLHPLGR